MDLFRVGADLFTATSEECSQRCIGLPSFLQLVEIGAALLQRNHTLSIRLMKYRFWRLL